MSKKTLKTAKKAQKHTKAHKLQGWIEAPREASTLNDIKSAVLVVSLTINLFIFITWLILRITTAYDVEVYNFLFVR